jgi:hypothetical protein
MWNVGAEIPVPSATIDDALRGTAGTSDLVSIAVLSLLFPEIDADQSLFDLADVERIPDEELEGGIARRIRGTWDDDTVVVWFDDETPQILRIDLDKADLRFDLISRVQTTITFDADVDAVIAVEELRFTQPSDE